MAWTFLGLASIDEMNAVVCLPVIGFGVGSLAMKHAVLVEHARQYKLTDDPVIINRLDAYSPIYRFLR